MPKITKRIVDAATVQAGRAYVWDSELRGFGLLVLASGTKTFVVQYRTSTGRSRRYTIGRFGTFTADQARIAAREVLVEAARGNDPVVEKTSRRYAPDVNGLLDRYLSEHVARHNATSTQKEVGRLVRLQLRPRLGSLAIADVGTKELAALHRAMSGTPRSANHTLTIASKVFNLAELWGLRPLNSNPTRGIKRYKENERDRFLSGPELQRLGLALVEAKTLGLPWSIKKPGNKHLPKGEPRTMPSSVALTAIELLLLTGARLSEITTLEWVHVDFERGMVALPSRKGDGRKPHPVSTPVLQMLAQLADARSSNWVLPRPGDVSRHISKEVIESTWQRLRVRAKIPDVRLHDLRHTVGTYASRFGSNAFLISHLLRQKNVTVTNRYVNPDIDPIRSVSESIGDQITTLLYGVLPTE